MKYSRRISAAWAVLALLLGLALTALVFHQQHMVQRQQQTNRLERLAEKSYHAIRAQLFMGEMLLREVQSLYLASEDVTPEEFSTLSQNLDLHAQFPSLQALAYAERVVRPDGVHFITTLVEPKAGNEAVQGLDVRMQPSNMAGLLDSIDTDKPTLSGPFRLAQYAHSNEPVDGVTIRLPVYAPGPVPKSVAMRQQRLRGSIAVSFRVGQLIRIAMPEMATTQFHVLVSDRSEQPAVTLFDSHKGSVVGGAGYHFQRDLAFGGRIWQVRMLAMPEATTIAFDPIVPITGTLSSVLLALLVYSILATRRRALLMAERMSERFQESELRFRTLNEQLPALVILAERRDGTVIYANQATRNRLGKNLEGRKLRDLFVDQACFRGLVEEGDHGLAHVEAELANPPREPFWATISLSPVKLDGDDKWLLVARDITRQRQLTEMLAHEASHDALTGLYNRREFESRLKEKLAGAHDGMPAAALLYIDLDQFKLINDTSGHSAGDRLLADLATTLQKHLGESELVARLGGDEFGVLIDNVGDVGSARERAEQLRQRIDEVLFAWDGREHTVSASIGGVLIDRPGLTMMELFRRADTACYLAKEAGRNRVHFHSGRDREVSRRHQEMEWANRLRWAIPEGRLVLAYQEMRALTHKGRGRLSLELLLRYRESDNNLLTPGAFMPAAERYGLMPMIDRWVVETALSHFDQLHPAGKSLSSVAINLSGASLEDDSMADWIVNLLHEHAVDPSRVCFEITETMAVRYLRQVITFLERVREIGCRTSLDDFGTGMSSFSYLKNLPVDVIKIDGSFVRDMMGNPVSLAVCKAVTDIGKSLKLDVVAEWVPDMITLKTLAEMGVSHAQSFMLHKPEVVAFQRQ